MSKIRTRSNLENWAAESHHPEKSLLPGKMASSGGGPKAENLTGQRFGKLIIQNRVEDYISPMGQRRAKWLCLCDCGSYSKVCDCSLKSGLTKSCGCGIGGSKNRIHGLTRTKVFQAWSSMKNRCYNHKCANYDSYGGRGISVCARWLNSFENFLKDMGQPPSKAHSIERKNNDGNYEPANCVWCTRKEQTRNTRGNVIITANGKTQCAADWADELGITRSTLYGRIWRGTPKESALYPTRKLGYYPRRKRHGITR